MPGTNHEPHGDHLGLTVPFQALTSVSGGSLSGSGVAPAAPMTLKINTPAGSSSPSTSATGPKSNSAG